MFESFTTGTSNQSLGSPSGKVCWSGTAHVPWTRDPYFELKGELAEGFIQLKVITHNNHPRLKGKGLPAGTMAELHRLTGLPIRSSMGLNPADGTDRRSPEATAMWEKWRPEGWRLTIWGPSQEPTISSIRPPFSQTPEGHCRHADHSRLSYGNNQFIGYQCLTG